ncbi:MAG TPA: ABC transporter permease subunit [Candidatus Saccharimonadales bacterium]|nr:ABC transporter permease subunit [Candidatus Saccharimonadales bacterium]
MKPALKAEFKKLLTVRSTYILMLIFLLLSAFFSFYVHGFRDSQAQSLMLSGQSPKDAAGAALFVSSSITQIANVVALAGGLIALLLLAHEYRYNTIIYTLAASNRRSKVLAAKIISVLCLVFVYTVIAGALSLALVWAGAAAAGHSLPAQNISFITFFAKLVFYSEAYSMAGLLFITLIRNQVGAIAALLILPNTVEGLLTLLLKKNSVYMPFTALSQVIQGPTIQGATPAHPARGDSTIGSLTPGKGALVYLCYLVGVWIIAWYLFLRRDATKLD